ncbi:NAD(P)/FAD-dependent oxidoreductase [Mycobacteroides sp. LB1]|uniref:NAD(P)/FAD-dependent oxidoreductase n=1 Tax=Mycobacteroides sp. LB1 TaxID=2750814 RepID=UPI0015DEED33|nr:NAD(P)/FAD-dependent oxidoreductase [Mycobacteroides sp. LB1]
MTDYDADLLIVGGGPAGLACALRARRQGLTVIVAEPRTSPIDKACGEGLMPGGLAELLELDVDPAGMPLCGITYLSERRRAQADFTGGTGRGVRRTTLHTALAERAKSTGTQSIAMRVSEVNQDRAGVSAAGIRAKWMIAADGLHSPVRRALGIATTAGRPHRHGVRRHYAMAPWSQYVEVYWSPWGEAYVTPVQPDLVGVAILSRHKQPDLAWFGQLSARLCDARPGPARGCSSLRQVVSRRVEGRVLLVGDAAGYEDALTGEGVSLAVKQAAAAIDAIVNDTPQSYEAAWHQVTRRYRYLTRGLVLATAPRLTRKAIVPASALAPALFRRAVNTLAG